MGEYRIVLVYSTIWYTDGTWS